MACFLDFLKNLKKKKTGEFLKMDLCRPCNSEQLICIAKVIKAKYIEVRFKMESYPPNG